MREQIRPANRAAPYPTNSGASTRPCILCGKCLDVCPLFAATGREELSPRGKSFLIRQALEEGNLHDPAAASKLLGLCLGCGRCADGCPQGRNLPELLREEKAGHPGWQAWVWRTWITQAKSLWPLVGRCAGLLPEQLGAGMMDAPRALVRRPSRERTSGGFERVADEAVLPGNAVLFPGCTARFARPWWVESAVRMLGAADDRLKGFPDWQCCGFTVAQAGLPGLNDEMRSQNVVLWRERGRPALLTICATCTTALHDYTKSKDLFQDDRERLAWEAAVQPLSGLVDPQDFRAGGDGTVLYHRPCHAPNPDPDAAFLRGVFATRLIAEAENACCGMGGVMRLSAPGLSSQVADRYWSLAPEQSELTVSTGCSGCAIQLAATAPQGVEVAHWLELFEG
ncbi:(Fe-S)-binding protein [Desulfonatronum thiodismutans]|uniref:(Fe-S)-binding protein n=1 Tax=Desulfonatronum thiodismutans TaxID=159290 RepID=UPI000A015C99|nr:(Fe-S)-binding protein [Desulfonatronum thiodismutans]